MAKQHVVSSLAISLAMNLAIAIGGFAALQGTAIAQDYRGTQEQQMACTPDVMRLCNDDLPDVDKIVACMKRNRANLSPACGAVFGVGLARREGKRR